MRTGILALVALSLGTSALAAGPAPVDAAGLKGVLAKHKGKVVVLNFWASWCAPCKAEFSDLVAAAKAKGADLVTVACDTPKDAATKSQTFLKLKNATANAYYNKAATNIDTYLKWLEPSAKAGAPIPRTYIFSKSGKLVSTLIGAQKGDAFEKAIAAAQVAK